MRVVGKKFKFFLLANGVKDDATKPMLLATVEMTALGYLHDLNMPTALDDNGVTFKKVLEQLQAHFRAKTTQLAARYEFGRLEQKESDTVDDFAAAIRKAAVQCGFGGDLDVWLQNQLLLGLKSKSIRKRIKRDGISFADALKLASDLERITREAKLGARTEASVSKVERPMPRNFESTASASTSTDRSEFNIGSK